MTARNEIRRELLRSKYAALILVAIFLVSIAAWLTTGWVSCFVIGMTVAGGFFIFRFNVFMGPKCPFCEELVPLLRGKEGDYCNQCGNSFDKKASHKTPQ